MPYTTSQYVGRTTDLNFTLFNQGFYDGNCLRMDGNIITAGSCVDVNAGPLINHNELNNLEWSVAGHILDTDLNVAGDVDPATTLSYSLGSGALRWLDLFVQNVNAEQIDTFDLVASGDVNATTFWGDGSNLTGVSGFDTNCEVPGSCSLIPYLNYNTNMGDLNILGDIVATDHDFIVLNGEYCDGSTCYTLAELREYFDTNIWTGVDQNIDMNSYHINNLASPFDDYDAVNKIWVENLVSNLNQKYFLTNTASGISDYFDTNLSDPGGAEVSDAHLGVVDDEYLRGWISPLGDTPTTLITGLYDFHVHTEKTNGGSKDLRIYFTIVERNADTTETIIATSELSGLITSKDEFDIHISLLSDVDINSDSRVIGKVYSSVSGSGGAPDVTLYFEGTTAGHFSTPVNEQILEGIFVKQDGTTPLTANWDAVFDINANAFYGIGDITTIGTITGGTLTDGTASLSSGALTGLTTPLTIAQGGTGSNTFITNTLTYKGPVGLLSLGNPATTGSMLKSNGPASLPSWSTTTYPNVIGLGQLLYATAPNALSASGTLVYDGTTLTSPNYATAGTMQGGSLTDGTATLTSGNLTGVGTIGASGDADLITLSSDNVLFTSNSGNVNIGNIGANYGAIWINRGSGAASNYAFTADSSHLYINIPTNDDILFRYNNATTMAALDATGLDVVGTVTGNDLIIDGTTATSAGKAITVNDSASAEWFSVSDNGQTTWQAANGVAYYKMHWDPTGSGNAGGLGLFGSSLFLWSPGSIQSINQGLKLYGTHPSGKSVSLYASTGAKPDLLVDDGDIKIPNDNAFLSFGNDGNTELYWDGANFIIDTNVNGGDGNAIFSNAVSATDFVERTSVFDETKGNALDLVKDVSELTNVDGSIKHDEFYGHIELETTDFARPWTRIEDVNVCELTEDGLQPCVMEKQEVTSYPYKTTTSGVSLGREISLLRQQVYDLKTESDYLKEELCNIGKNVYSWCGTIQGTGS